MTAAIGQELIERLAAGIRPEAAGETLRTAGDDRFANLLFKAASGEVSSGLPITIARGVDVQLSPETLEKVSSLVDRAQAQGASKALVLTDEGMLELDVLRRRVEGVVDPALQDSVLTGFDAVLVATTDERDPSELHGPLMLPDRGLSASAHDSLLRALGDSASTNR